MNTFTKYYLRTLLALLVLDGIWLGSTSQTIYAVYLKHLMGDTAVIWPALLFYPVYALTVTMLVVLPTVRAGKGTGHAFLMGAVLGLGAYGAYDFTNQATLRDWPLVITVVDLAWGTFVTGTGAAIAASRWLQKRR